MFLSENNSIVHEPFANANHFCSYSFLVSIREISRLPCMQVRLTGFSSNLYEENAKQIPWLKASKGGETIHG